MSKVIRISDKTEKYLKEWKQAAIKEKELTGERAFYKEIEESEDFAIKCALVSAINYQIQYLKSKGIDIIIKKE